MLSRKEQSLGSREAVKSKFASILLLSALSEYLERASRPNDLYAL